jgi:hemoglobin-like flavoprotein
MLQLRTKSGSRSGNASPRIDCVGCLGHGTQDPNPPAAAIRLAGVVDATAGEAVSPDQIKLLQNSFDRLWVSGRVVDLFYDRLFTIAPHTRPLFPADMEAQKLKLTNMVASIVGLVEREDMFISIIESLGRRHVRYGVADTDYAHVHDALMWSLAQAFGREFDDDMRLAWATLYETARGIMIAASRTHGRAGLAQ